MSQEIRVFSNQEFGNVRVIEKDGEPWFVGKDVAEVLGYGDTSQAIRKHVDEEDKLTSRFDGSGQNREMVIINESGLYSLVLSSKLPSAKSFKRWITSEVIPFIRKHGAYLTDNLIESFMQDPRKMGEFFIMYADERDRRKQAELESAHKTQVITGLTEDISLAEKRQHINQIVRFRATGKQYSARWSLLYSEFEKKYHINLKLRYEKNKKNYKPQLKSVVDYVDRGLNMVDELYELTCKLFESDFDKLMEEWAGTIKLENVVNANFT